MERTPPAKIHPALEAAAIPASQNTEAFDAVIVPNQPQYSCLSCKMNFNLEPQIIRHIATHSEEIPLRYRDTSKKDPVTGEPQVYEIKFGCSLCLLPFASLPLATQHVHEHKQAWKCAHCIKLFLTPAESLSHMKDAHPEVPARLESIDSPKEVFERLRKTIMITKCYFQPPRGDARVLPVSGKASMAAPAPATSRPTQVVARMSTSRQCLKKTKRRLRSSQQ